MKYLRNEPLSRHTSFKIGGPANYFCLPKSIGNIKEVLSFARQNKLKIAVIGAGSNLLAPDQGFSGLVIKIGQGLAWVKAKGDRVSVGAGVGLARLVKLGGLEFLAGIPGSVGGAVVMNAGAWGEEIGKYVEQVTVLDGAGRVKEIKRKNLGFAYRKSKLQKSRFIVAEVVFKLDRIRQRVKQEKIKEYLAKRRARHPLDRPSCGSVFKNPRGLTAGALIEAAGCQGKRIGDAQVSKKHANFIVNLGGAKAADVIKLISIVQKAVNNKFKVLLEPELKTMVQSKL
ncbi:UDP-N-acetylenolpyruvoylglucosamine reductase [candidate division WOR-1 bacterium RIFCSPLOWO2_02_FULL_46_20]|uniref:UDP-N-acetylenolpyruvoylglucosamine reductase n=1 Tax=candidate division WOR-1 bacterium RIFCSPLOWO2_02_FULL_46_20 TaxID=1802567 RepID=A0A1F4RD95_UNCSA|nr:MAG: UDP-N-acetylenolpyruvoylglucosamine reductase [candidate division WOR-1 bacterium RIFCSPLOWO2_02_FULL_46_20]